MLSAVINWLFPANCSVCSEKGAYLCDDCLAKCERAKSIAYPPGEKPWIEALFSYKDRAVRRAIWEIKYHGKFVAAHVFGEMLAEAAYSLLLGPFGAPSFDVNGIEDVLIIPIPASKYGRRRRGYNQALIIARALLDHAPFPAEIEKNALEKIKHTERQATLRNRGQRLRNMEGAFAADEKVVRGRIVLLVDDVTTTGATLRDAKRAMLEAGAKEVWGVCVGH